MGHHYGETENDASYPTKAKAMARPYSDIAVGGSAVGRQRGVSDYGLNAVSPTQRTTLGSDAATGLTRNEDATNEAYKLVTQLRSLLIGGWPENAQPADKVPSQPEALLSAFAYRLHRNASSLCDVNDHLRAILMELGQ